MFKTKLVVFLTILVTCLNPAFANNEPLQRAVRVYCNDVSKTMAKINGKMVFSWMDEDENIWVNFKDKKDIVVMGVIPSDNRKEMCIVSYGVQINKSKVSF